MTAGFSTRMFRTKCQANFAAVVMINTPRRRRVPRVVGPGLPAVMADVAVQELRSVDGYALDTQGLYDVI